MKKYLIIGFVLLINTSIAAQKPSDWIFDDTVLPEVHITIDQDSLSQILDPDNVQSDYEFPATFEFIKGDESEIVENIGFRLRGNTSRYSHKKSFKVSFNTFESGRQYRGLDKMNLNGEHNDPSIIRSKLSWDFFEEIGLPAPRANHIKLYINEEYYGLYINVEHIDDEFVEDRFGTDAGNLYKCLYPADLTYGGSDPASYRDYYANGRPVYELKTNKEANDYSDLTYLIYFFENATDLKFRKEVEDYLNVDGVLQWMAVEVLTGNWDDYWYNKNNYYLYNNPVQNRFEFIPYDYDNTFGIDWIGQDGSPPDWGTRGINNWGSDNSNESRPLTDRLLEVDEYRNRFNFYVNKYLDEYFNSGVLNGRINVLKMMVQEAAEEDIYRILDYGYTISDYNDSFNEALGGHAEYGLKPYISTRHNAALNQLQLEDITPIIRSVEGELNSANGQKMLTIRAEVLDEDIPEVMATIDVDDISAVQLMDNGTGADAVANDGIYSANVSIGNHSGDLSYFIEATDSKDKTGRYPNNSDRNIIIEQQESLNTILINEFMADNETTILDDFGDYEDWIELYNPTGNAISLKNYYLTDDFNEPKKWALPDTTIASNNYLLIWADNDDEEGPLHTNFGLNNEGEEVGLFHQDVLELKIVDTLSFGPQTDDISFGRETDGAENFVFFENATPSTSNDNATSNEVYQLLPDTPTLYQNYPNPFNPVTTISFSLPEATEAELSIYTINGRLIQTIVSSRLNAGMHDFRFDASHLASGIYFYQLKTENQTLSRRFALIK